MPKRRRVKKLSLAPKALPAGVIPGPTQAINRTIFPARKQSVEQWAAYNGREDEATTSDKTIDLDKRIEGDETTIAQYTSRCKPGGAAELWGIGGGGHIPSLSDTFNQLVIEWLLAHPKSAHGEAAD